MMKPSTIAILTFAAMVAFGLPAMAQEAGEAHHEEQGETTSHTGEDAHEENGEVGGHHNGREFKNEVAVFLGATDESGHDTEFTWGFDYKRAIAKTVAVGGLFDYAGGDLRNAVIAPMVIWWPGLGKLQFLAAPGVEFHNGRNGGGHEAKSGGKGEHGEDKDATYFLFRLGVAYDIHLPKGFGIVPTVNVDLVNGETVWVYGLAFSYGF